MIHLVVKTKKMFTTVEQGLSSNVIKTKDGLTVKVTPSEELSNEIIRNTKKEKIIICIKRVAILSLILCKYALNINLFMLVYKE